jgi:hypothetical protein
VAELAEKIKVLREANTVEAVPERTVRKAARAERPVTARIRVRLEEATPIVAPEVPAIAPTVIEVESEEDDTPAAPPAAAIAMHEQARNGHARAVLKRRQGGGE